LAKSTGFDLIYEARDLDLPQNVRDGLTQARSSVEATKKRVSESKRRITNEVRNLVERAYWNEAREALRLQVGTLRFDLNTLTDTKTISARKTIRATQKRFFTEIERVDFAIREKDSKSAIEAYDRAVIILADLLDEVL
jgi:photosystem II oxygen-evolving enhancer protein 3